jgi:phosphoglycolate phosphatase
VAFDAVLFDLDGTLTDPLTGIANALRHALARFDIPAPADTSLSRYIGPPLQEIFAAGFNLSAADTASAVGYYREYYAATGWQENCVYDGIPELLERLNARGLRLAVATSKAAVFAERIVAHFGLDRHLAGVSGASLDGLVSAKGDVIRLALSRFAFDPARTVMVGDRSHDIAGARENGLDSIGVTYGYGSLTELRDSGAGWIAGSVAALGSRLAP